MTNPWPAEIWRAAVLLAIALLLGGLTRHVGFALFLATSVYLAWHILRLLRLERWLQDGAHGQSPSVIGVYDEIFYQIQRLKERFGKRERKLRGLLERYQESASAMPDATVMLGASGEIEWFNEAAGRLLGLHSPQDHGQRLVNLVRHPAFTEYVRQEAFNETVEFPSPVDARVMLDVSVTPYGNNQRLLVARDVSRLHRLEQIRRDFVANVSHEMRTPLTVIGGVVETLLDGDDECTRQWGRSLTLMQQQTQRLQRLVEDLLLLSRLETERKQPAREPVAMPALVTAVRDDAAALSADCGHDIQSEVDPGLWLLGAENELRSAVSNLVFNAVHYTPAPGRITLRWYAGETGACLEVSDTGIGIAPHHIPRLTERFYRVDVGRSRDTGGTGLGLAIVKHVLERHEARLEIRSELGKGSAFLCHFPPERLIRK